MSNRYPSDGRYSIGLYQPGYELSHLSSEDLSRGYQRMQLYKVRFD